MMHSPLSKYPEIYNLLLLRIDLDMKDNAERTSLHYCSLEGHAEIVQLLLTFGALDSCIDSQGLVVTLRHFHSHQP